MNHTPAEVITEKQWDSAVSRAFRAEIKTAGRAMSNATISNNAGRTHIIEVRSGTLVVRDGWRDAIKAAAVSKTEAR